MKKPFFVLVYLIVYFNGVSQLISRVDFDLIKNNIQDVHSKFYYPELVKRLLEKDSALNEVEYTHLYYGSVFQKEYQPYGMSILKKRFIEEYNSKEYKKAVETAEHALTETPVDLEILLKLSICYLELGSQNEKRAYAKIYFSFLDVIYQSGNGADINSAYVVVSVNDEYSILEDLSLTAVKQQLIGDCDVLSFRRRDQDRIKGAKKIKELYFNVKKPLMSLSNSYKNVDLPEAED